MTNKDESLYGLLAVALASFLWGTTGTAASFTENVSPLATGAFAMGVAGVLLVLFSHKKLRKEAKLLTANRMTLVLGGCAVAVYPLAFYTSMRLSGVAIGTVVSIASAPLFTVLLERLISKKSIEPKWVLSFFIGVVGVVLLCLGKQNVVAQDTVVIGNYIGICLGILAALSYACYSWTARLLIETGVSSSSAMSAQFGFASFMLLPSLYFTGNNLFQDTQNTCVAIYMAFIPMFLGYLLFGYALRKIEASKATLMTLLEPAIATLFAIFIVGETFSAVGLLGIFLIGTSMLIQMIKISEGERVSNSYQ